MTVKAQTNNRTLSFLHFGGNVLFFLLIFVIMLDPTARVLHLKDWVFMLFVAYNVLFLRPEFRYVPHLVILFSTITVAYLLAEIQGNSLDYDQLLSVYKSFSPLVLLLWIKHYKVIRISLLPGGLLALFITILYIAASSNPVIERAIYLFVRQNDDMIMMSHRTFLGFTFFNMYYKSVVSLVFVLFMFYFMIFHKQGGRWKWLVWAGALMATFAFLVSGSRSTILLPFAVLGFVTYRSLNAHPTAKYFFYPLLALIALLFIALIVVLASESSEKSNVIKYGHLASYAQLFTDHPEYLLIGEGPATKFYSAGFHRMTLLTEWTYIELIRNYGLLALAIMGVMLYPLKRILQDRNNNLSFGIAASYIIYFLVAGTNPLLFSSTGMIMILSAYSYARELELKDEQVVNAVGKEHKEMRMIS